MPTEKKVQITSQLKELFDGAETLIFVDYSSLDANSLNQLRAGLREVNSRLLVAKNTLIQRASLLSGKNQDLGPLSGATAVIAGFDDSLSPIKKLVDFIKERGLPQVKFAFFSGSRLNSSQTATLAEIPSREVLLTNLLGELELPLVRLVRLGYEPVRKLTTTISSIAKAKP